MPITDDQEVLAIRAKFEELYSKFKTETDAAAEKVRAAGGLYILGTERHESRRIDNQLRGRSGRQGDPGESRFYISLEDDLMRLFGSERIQNMMDTLALPMTSRSTRRFCPARSKMPEEDRIPQLRRS